MSASHSPLTPPSEGGSLDTLDSSLAGASAKGALFSRHLAALAECESAARALTPDADLQEWLTTARAAALAAATDARGALTSSPQAGGPSSELLALRASLFEPLAARLLRLLYGLEAGTEPDGPRVALIPLAAESPGEGDILRFLAICPYRTLRLCSNLLASFSLGGSGPGPAAMRFAHGLVRVLRGAVFPGPGALVALLEEMARPDAAEFTAFHVDGVTADPAPVPLAQLTAGFQAVATIPDRLLRLFPAGVDDFFWPDHFYQYLSSEIARASVAGALATAPAHYLAGFLLAGLLQRGAALPGGDAMPEILPTGLSPAEQHAIRRLFQHGPPSTFRGNPCLGAAVAGAAVALLSPGPGPHASGGCLWRGMAAHPSARTPGSPHHQWLRACLELAGAMLTGAGDFWPVAGQPAGSLVWLLTGQAPEAAPLAAPPAAAAATAAGPALLAAYLAVLDRLDIRQALLGKGPHLAAPFSGLRPAVAFLGENLLPASTKDWTLIGILPALGFAAAVGLAARGTADLLRTELAYLMPAWARLCRAGEPAQTLVLGCAMLLMLAFATGPPGKCPANARTLGGLASGRPALLDHSQVIDALSPCVDALSVGAASLSDSMRCFGLACVEEVVRFLANAGDAGVELSVDFELPNGDPFVRVARLLAGLRPATLDTVPAFGQGLCRELLLVSGPAHGVAPCEGLAALRRTAHQPPPSPGPAPGLATAEAAGGPTGQPDPDPDPEEDDVFASYAAPAGARAAPPTGQRILHLAQCSDVLATLAAFSQTSGAGAAAARRGPVLERVRPGDDDDPAGPGDLGTGGGPAEGEDPWQDPGYVAGRARAALEAVARIAGSFPPGGGPGFQATTARGLARQVALLSDSYGTGALLAAEAVRNRPAGARAPSSAEVALLADALFEGLQARALVALVVAWPTAAGADGLLWDVALAGGPSHAGAPVRIGHEARVRALNATLQAVALLAGSADSPPGMGLPGAGPPPGPGPALPKGTVWRSSRLDGPRSGPLAAGRTRRRHFAALGPRLLRPLLLLFSSTGPLAGGDPAPMPGPDGRPSGPRREVLGDTPDPLARALRIVGEDAGRAPGPAASTPLTMLGAGVGAGPPWLHSPMVAAAALTLAAALTHAWAAEELADASSGAFALLELAQHSVLPALDAPAGGPAADRLRPWADQLRAALLDCLQAAGHCIAQGARAAGPGSLLPDVEALAGSLRDDALAGLGLGRFLLDAGAALTGQPAVPGAGLITATVRQTHAEERRIAGVEALRDWCIRLADSPDHSNSQRSAAAAAALALDAAWKALCGLELEDYHHQ
ncbi:hypothetical protein H696_02031 [Fonticula alba]|uniref:Uncharacterized protein n=1 Tax=Fonticula alba TaxID=691883 RepID=A0A058ZCC1_FONAL|nr:hypothetical protein H696_02031 [Fonticula alba]KCV71082.1 hypothetical protein H696_02031 [Fonticula alba]|eukprot:XP_009494205.1 hypothetical protein H696_02031 [Fonticula alba]